MLLHREIVKQLRIVRYVGRTAFDFERVAIEIESGDAQLPTARRDDPCQCRNVVVFPAPLGPTNPKTCPGAT